MTVTRTVEDERLDQNSELQFENAWKALRLQLEARFSCQLCLKKIDHRPKSSVIIMLTGKLVGSPFRFSRLRLRNIFPWEKIQPEIQEFLTDQFGVEKFNLVCLEDNPESDTR